MNIKNAHNYIYMGIVHHCLLLFQRGQPPDAKKRFSLKKRSRTPPDAPDATGSDGKIRLLDGKIRFPDGSPKNLPVPHHKKGPCQKKPFQADFSHSHNPLMGVSWGIWPSIPEAFWNFWLPWYIWRRSVVPHQTTGLPKDTQHTWSWGPWCYLPWAGKLI